MEGNKRNSMKKYDKIQKIDQNFNEIREKMKEKLIWMRKFEKNLNEKYFYRGNEKNRNLFRELNNDSGLERSNE